MRHLCFTGRASLLRTLSSKKYIRRVACAHPADKPYLVIKVCNAAKSHSKSCKEVVSAQSAARCIFFDPMLKYALFFSLLLSCIGTRAQDGPVQFAAGVVFDDHVDNDSIRRLLNRIHLVRQANPDSALSVLYGVYHSCMRRGFLAGAGAASSEIGSTYIYTGDYKKAEKFILFSHLFPKLNEYVTTSGFNDLGTIYESWGKYDLALQYLKKAMTSKDNNVANSAYNNYIVLLLKQERYKESLYYIDILKKRAKALKQKRILAAALCNEGSVWYILKDYRKGDSVTAECLKLCTEPSFDMIAAYSLICCADSYVDRGDVPRAIGIFSGLREKMRRLDPGNQMEYYSEYGMALYKIGDYNAAVDYLRRSVRMAGEIGITDNATTVLYLARAYRATGEHALANKYFEDYIRFTDSFRSTEVQKGISEYEVKFRTSEKDNELLKERLTVTSQSARISRKNVLIAGTCASLVVLLALFFVYRRYTRQNLLVLERDLAIAEQKSKIDFLEAMMQGEEKERRRIGIELHNGISSMLTAVNLNLRAFQLKNKQVTEVGSIDEIIEQIQHTTAEVRKTAHNLLPAAIIESGLHHAVQEFIKQFRNGPAEVRLVQHGKLDVLSPSLALLVYRILQELINNAIKYAEASIIDVRLSLDGSVLSAAVTDNGKGFDPGDVHRKGQGIRQIQEQLELLKGRFRIATRPGAGTAVSFEIDLKHGANNRLP